MTHVRRNVWTLTPPGAVWHPVTAAYAGAIREMQQLPLTDPRSWAYQSAIHGLANTPPPRGAPWNQCQHGSWYFLPWHRMYLFQFEDIVRSFVDPAVIDPDEWALPYWDYDQPGQSALPMAFRAPTMDDGSPNPLRVDARRTDPVVINDGFSIPDSFTSASDAMNTTEFVTPAGGTPRGFGGPRTNFSHGGRDRGRLESQPHDIMHVVIGGNGGLMTDPDTAAADPIFWLHHANIDRLWETWRVAGNDNPTVLRWTRRTFRLRRADGSSTRMRIADVVDAENQLDYTYEDLPGRPVGAAPPIVAGQGGSMGRRRPKMVGRTDAVGAVTTDGFEATVEIGDLPSPRRARGAAAAPAERRFHIELSDIVGTTNPGVVYGVYVNLPEEPSSDDLEDHRVGLISLFGIEHSTDSRGGPPEPLRYSFDITALIDDGDDPGSVTVSLRPMAGTELSAARGAAAPDLRIGTVAVHVT